MRKTARRIAKITGITLLLLIAAALLIPILFKKQITTLVKKEINKSLVATVDFSDVSLSFFRHFPKLSVSIKDLSVVGTDVFAADTLIASQRVDASVNLFSLFSGSEIKVSGVYLESPRIHALVNKEGKANWDIAKSDSTNSDTSVSEPSSFRMSLKKYEINDGYIFYKDEASDMSMELKGLDHSGSGNLTESIFTLATSTSINSAGFTYASIPYLINTKTTVNTDISINNETSTYTFKTDDIELNNLKLNADGFFQLVNDSTYAMDIKFKTPSNEFKDILSLVPGIYTKDFENIKTSGLAEFEGFVKGTYSPQKLPAYDVKLNVKDGSFQYPDLPKPVKNIQVAMRAQNADGQFDNTIIDISKAHLEFDNEPFDIRFLLKNPETAQYIDAAAKGRLDLSNISRFIKLEDGMKLSGSILADAFAKGNFSAIESQSGSFSAGGFLDVSKLFFSSKQFPQPLQNGNMKINITNQGGVADNTNVSIDNGHIEVGNDAIDFTLAIQKPVSLVEFAGSAKGSFTLANIKQFVELEQGTDLSGLLSADISFAGNKKAIDNGDYDRINLSGTAGVTDLQYKSNDYPSGIKLSTAKLSFREKNMQLSNLKGNYLKTNFSADGNFTNLVGFAIKDEPLSGKLNLVADNIVLEDWMGTTETTKSPSTSSSTNTTAGSETSSAFVVPAGIDVTVSAKADRVSYDKVNYDNINGSLAVKDQTVSLQNMRANALDGSMVINGTYSTKHNSKVPAISLSYEVKDLDVQKTFTSFNTVQALMPIAKFLSGKLSSELSLTGTLDGSMMPDLKTLTGKGNLLLLNGVLQKFGPVEKLAATLQIDRLKSFSLRDIKNYFEFANGTVLVKPFTIKIEEMELQIGGTHGLDQSMDYVIAMKVPRKYMGNAGNNMVNNLVSKANNKGIPVKLGEMIDLNVKMTGSISNPNIAVDLKQVAGDAIQDLKQQALDFAKAKADSANQRLKDTLTSVKNQVVNDLKEDLKNKIFGKDTLKDAEQKPKPVDNLKKSIGDLLNKKKKPVTDTIKK